MRFFNVENSLDYYSFGMLMPERFGGGDYRYGYQGSEKDNEVKGEGNSYTTHFRQLDPRLGRWLTIDPKASSLPWQSPYCSMDNNPVLLNDVLGDSTDYGVTDGGRIYQIGETNDEPDRLFKIDNSKNKIDLNKNGRTNDDYITVKNKNILKTFKEKEGTFISDINGKEYPHAPKVSPIALSDDGKEMSKMFYFLANNTNVEFALVNYTDGLYGIGTLYQTNGSPSIQSFNNESDKSISEVKTWIHSHPYDNSHKTLEGRLYSMGEDNQIQIDYRKSYKFTGKMLVFFPRHREVFELTKEGNSKRSYIESYWGILKLTR